MSACEADASPVSRFPKDSMIRIGPAGAEDEEMAGEPRQPRHPSFKQFDVERCAGPVQIRRVGRAERAPSGAASAAADASRGELCRRRLPTHIARPKVPRQNIPGAARRAIPTATRGERAHPMMGPMAPGRPPPARARHNARPGPRPRQAALIPRRRTPGPDATTGPPVERDSDRRGPHADRQTRPT